MKYKVGDKVLVEAEILEVDFRDVSHPYRVAFSSEEYIWLNKKDLFKPNKTYEDGLNDAWELVEKIFEMPIDEREMALSIDEHYLEDILVRLTPQEALAKIEAYEKSKQIQVGDVVYANGVQGVVIDIISDDDCYIYDENGCIEVVKFEKINKTGRTVDIEHLLEQIRGDE